MARTGRPQLKPTKPQRDQVMRLRADGWAIERIARVMSIDAKTLEKHFSSELEHGADIKTNALLEYAEKAAKRGSQASIKWLSERYAVARAAEQVEGRERQPQPSGQAGQRREPALGKKEQRQQAAEDVTGLYEPPPPPAVKVH